MLRIPVDEAELLNRLEDSTKYPWRASDLSRIPSERELRVISCDFSAAQMDTVSSSVLPYPKRSVIYQPKKKRVVDFACQAEGSDKAILDRAAIRSKTGFADVGKGSVQSAPPKSTSPRTALTQPTQKNEISKLRASDTKMGGKQQIAKGSIYKQSAERTPEIKELWPKKQVVFSDKTSSFKEDGFLSAYKEKMKNKK